MTSDSKASKSWLDARVSRRRLLALSGLAAIGGFVGYKLLGGFGEFRLNTIEASNPRFDPLSYRLVVDGLVDNPLSLTYDQLLALPSIHQVSDFHCVEGWGVQNVRWEGVRLQTILDLAHPKQQAAFVTFHALDGFYTDSLSISQGSLPDALLAYRMYDAPLPPEHGAPLRFVMPKMYGYKGTKFVTRLELVPSQVTGYWEQRGWQVNGWIA